MTEITLNHITKIEGHATLEVEVRRGNVVKCELSSVEGSRYFEGIVKGRRYYEAPEITSRICGICSCAHTVAAIMAIEDALAVKPSRQTVLLRRLLMIGERIRSHATHLYFLALPDYFGKESALAMLPKFEPEVRRALGMMKSGNNIVKAVGGRDLHPVSAAVGGFLAVPTPAQVKAIASDMDALLPAAAATAELFGSLKAPQYDHPTQYVSLYDGKGYPMLNGRIMSSGKSFSKRDYKSHIEEYHEPQSTANFVVKEGKSYMVGALSRVNNGFRFLSPDAKSIARKCKITFPQANPYMNNFCQALELVHYCHEVRQICRQLAKIRREPLAKISVKAGTGIAAIEVPRGILFHEYRLDAGGVITHANIVTPTAQNLRNMQDDIRGYLPTVIRRPRRQIVAGVEELIRSYDPCFSCSTHFLKVKWRNAGKRGGA